MSSEMAPAAEGEVPFEGTAEEQAAAVRIQAMQRGKAARKEVEDIKNKLKEAEEKLVEEVCFEGTPEEQAAALKIQTIQRGKAARKEVAEMRKAAGGAGEAAGEEEVAFEGTAEEEAAALKIQTIQRGKAARKEVNALREQLKQAEQQVAEIVEIEGTADEQAAAVKIQALHRGRAARREMEEKKAKLKEAEEALEEIVEFEGNPREQAAAVKIQAMQRGKAARKEVEEKKAQLREAEKQLEEVLFEGTPEEQAAATKIQALQRGKAARKEILERKAIAAVGTKEMTKVLEDIDALDEEEEVEKVAEYHNDDNLTGYDPPKELLERGLTPEQVATTFYTALYENELLLWLATLCEINKIDPKPPKPGGFATVGWKDGRNKLRKYGCHYKYVGEAKAEGKDRKHPNFGTQDAPTKTLLYQPLYGHVPGYKPDTPMKDPVRITLMDELDEWRVLRAEF
eukprot:CAMPEP_0118924316 /NCGR_PEP_ID=MMETSP1169-20130426/2506_1 /TAXON_ID=36882 /ORGANISM="Pyramimonas obovata, Strain CCMP722" /LENGTH=455 /DNA_ID=CAMNT_0006865413 /DNA_START=317 /DNA_END=1684 /DNA_ORIENTATION=+